MRTPTRGATRVGRAAFFGVATLALASGVHVSAGGALPSMMVLALLAVPLTMAAVVLTGRRCGPVLLLSSLATAQVVLHETLMALASHVPSDTVPAALGTQHGEHALVSGQVSAHTASEMGGVALAGANDWSITMTTVHAVATIVTALLIARGEQTLWHLVAMLMPAALPRIPRLLGCGPRQAPIPLSVPGLRPSLASGGPGLRGPPVRFAATA